MATWGDVFGQQLYDHHLGLIPDEYREVGERDDGYLQVYDHPRWYFAEIDAWPRHHQVAMEYVRGRTLDVGCGAGRVALHLQSCGLEVVGIDTSPLALRTCQERGALDLRLLSITQVSVNRLGTFDSIVMLGNNFGLFRNRERAVRLLRRFHRMTTAGGRIIAESTDPYATDDPDHVAYQAQNRKRGRMSGQYRHRERYRNLKGPWYDWLFVSQDEMRGIVDGTGWDAGEFVDGENGAYVTVLEKNGDVRASN